MGNTSMLEQAIIDAAQLKEAALKNAQNALLEKHASELKNIVNSLLTEAADNPLAPEDDEVPMPDPGLGGGMPGMGIEPTSEDPMAQNIPSAATDGEKACPCPEEDEEIEIDFDQLMGQMNGQDNQMPGQFGEVPGDESQLMEGNEKAVAIPPELGNELHLYHTSMGDPLYKVGTLAISGQPVPQQLFEDAIENLEAIKPKMDESAQKNIDMLLEKLYSLNNSNPEGQLPSDIGLTAEVLSRILENIEKEKNGNLEEKFQDLGQQDRFDLEPTQFGYDDETHIEPTYIKPTNQASQAELRAALNQKAGIDPVWDRPAIGGETPVDLGRKGELQRKADLMAQRRGLNQEQLHVNMKNVPTGQIRPNHTQAEEAVEIELARNQDVNISKENEDLKKAIKDLQETNKNLNEQVKNINIEYSNISKLAQTAVEKLNKLNINSAKLMYENLALKSDSLNERQKKQFVDAISKANSVEEAKTVYETLNTSFSSKTSHIEIPKTLNEAIKNSKMVITSLGNNRNKNVISEGIDPVKDRMMQLAGIKK